MPEQAPTSEDARAIWRQDAIPVVYRTHRQPLTVKVPYSADNRDWLQDGRRLRPQWRKQVKGWLMPKTWFNDVIMLILERWGRVYVIQPYRTQERCAPACWNAQGFECECSCMGANHGSEASGNWRVISETFAVQWGDTQLACRLITRPDQARWIKPAESD